MLSIRVVMGHNEIMKVSEALVGLVGGLTVYNAKGRGKIPAPTMHTSKGSETFVPYFSEKFVLEVVIDETKELEVIKIIKEKVSVGKIFVIPGVEAIDIATGDKGENVI